MLRCPRSVGKPALDNRLTPTRRRTLPAKATTGTPSTALRRGGPMYGNDRARCPLRIQFQAAGYRARNRADQCGQPRSQPREQSLEALPASALWKAKCLSISLPSGTVENFDHRAMTPGITRGVVEAAERNMPFAQGAARPLPDCPPAAHRPGTSAATARAFRCGHARSARRVGVGIRDPVIHGGQPGGIGIAHISHLYGSGLWAKPAAGSAPCARQGPPECRFHLSDLRADLLGGLR